MKAWSRARQPRPRRSGGVQYRVLAEAGPIAYSPKWRPSGVPTGEAVMKLLWAGVMVPGLACTLFVLNALATEAVGAAPPPPDDAGKLPAALMKSAPESVEDLKAIQDQVKLVLKKTMPATVAIVIPDPRGRGVAAGSGVIISEDGYVLTAGHISQKPHEKCTIILPDGKRIKGETLGWNRARDAGLVKITDKGKWPYVKQGDSSKLKVGEWCLTVGHPGGYKPGRPPVVRLGRIMGNRNFVQTDTPLVGGDSGGPLFDLHGRVIGIHRWISQEIQGNMHVPVNIYKDNWDRLVKGEEWGRELGARGDRPRSPVHLGVAFDIDTDDLKLTEVYRRTPASRAGLQAGDVLLKADDQKLAKRTDLMRFLAKKKPGENVTFEVERDGKTTKIVLTLGQPDSDDRGLRELLTHVPPACPSPPRAGRRAGRRPRARPGDPRAGPAQRPADPQQPHRRGGVQERRRQTQREHRPRHVRRPGR